MRNLGLMSVLMALFVAGCGFEIIDTGHRGVEVRYGKIQGGPLPEGLAFYNPFTTDVIELDVRENILEEETVAFTKDTQQVKIKYAVAYYPDPSQIHVTYNQFGYDWPTKTVNPAVLSALKDTVGQYVADDLVSKREAARNAVLAELAESLKTRNVVVTRVDFTNLDFDDAYENAVEAKVTAVQKAAQAKNKTVEVEEMAKQQIISAEAEAKSMRIRSEALSQNKSLVEYEAVQKWDGKMPVYMLGGGATPFISLGAKSP